MNRAEEDYLKLIYELDKTSQDPYIKTSYLAERFGYTLQSVNEMVKRLSQKDLLSFEPYKGVRLKDKGKNEALRMIRAHRLWEVFLSQKLGMGWEELHEEAEKLEHATSLNVLEKLYSFLDEPEHCIHGNPIPNALGELPHDDYVALWDATEGTTFRVRRVLDYKQLLTYLKSHRIALDSLLYIENKDPFGKIVHVHHNGRSIPLGKNIATMIYGEMHTDD